MSHQWRCLSCSMFQHSFCAAVFGKTSENAKLTRQPSWQDFKKVRARSTIVKRGDVSRYIHVLCHGWAFRLYRLFDGQRQILNVLLPGDLFSAATVVADRIPFTVDALSDVQVSRLDRAEVLERLQANPNFLAELSELYTTEQNTADEMITVLGKRSADQRVAYLFLHLIKRIASGHEGNAQCYPFVLRQHHIADMMGLTSVTVSRILGAFRSQGLAEISQGSLKVLDPAELDRLGSLK